MSDPPYNEFRLGDWLVTPLRGVIHGPEGTRRVTPKAMDVLLCMARRPGEVVDRETFQKEVWDDRVFGDDPLNKCIAELRRQLGDRGGKRAYIETVPKRGYRLVAKPTPIGEAPPPGRRKGFRKHLRAIALAVLFALAAVGAWRITQDVAPDSKTAVAVLPFASPDEADKQYFADGVHEELISELSRGDALTVRSRSSTLAFSTRETPLRDIAAQLGVDVLVDGSVRQDGDTVRVTAQLIDAATDENLWAGSIEKSLSVAGLFEIQSEIAHEIATALKVTLGDASMERPGQLPTDNLQAYDAFMLGKFHYRRQLPGDLRESVMHFERAVALDPVFAEAWDWLAYAYNHAATGVGYLSPDEAYPKARAAALRALELEPDLATAQSLLGYIRAVYDRDWIGAESDLRRAVRLAPADSGTVWSLAHVYAMLGRHDEAIKLTRDYALRFPGRGRSHLEVANRLVDAGRFEDALDELELAATHDAEPAAVADLRGTALMALDRMDEAATTFEFAVEARQRHPFTVGKLAFVYGRLGRTADASALFDELERRSRAERIPRLAFATARMGLGDVDGALADLRAAADNGGREIISLRQDPFFTGLHGHPRFEALITELGLPAP